MAVLSLKITQLLLEHGQPRYHNCLGFQWATGLQQDKQKEFRFRSKSLSFRIPSTRITLQWSLLLANYFDKFQVYLEGIENFEGRVFWMLTNNRNYNENKNWRIENNKKKDNKSKKNWSLFIWLRTIDTGWCSKVEESASSLFDAIKGFWHTRFLSNNWTKMSYLNIKVELVRLGIWIKWCLIWTKEKTLVTWNPSLLVYRKWLKLRG